LVSLKSPLDWILDIDIDSSPVLVSTTLCEALLVPTNCAAKVKLLGDRLATGPIPAPLREIDCGLLAALSVTETEAERVPRAVGVKVTLI